MSSIDDLPLCDEFLIPRMQKTKPLQGHSGCVNCLKFSADGNYLFSGSDDGSVKMWDMSQPWENKNSVSSNCVSTLTGHTSNVFALEIMPNGPFSHLIISGGNDADCRIFDLNTGRCRNVLKQFERKVMAISAPKACGNTFLACSYDGTVRFYDLRDRLGQQEDLNSSNRQGVMPPRIRPQIFGGGFEQSGDSASSKSHRNLLLDFTKNRHEKVTALDHHPINCNLFVVSTNGDEVLTFDQRYILLDPYKCAVQSYKNEQFRRPKYHESTSVKFSPEGDEVLVSYMHDGMCLYSSDIPDKNLIDLDLALPLEMAWLFNQRTLKNSEPQKQNESSPDMTENASPVEEDISEEELSDGIELIVDESLNEQGENVIIVRRAFMTSHLFVPRDESYYIDSQRPKRYSHRYAGHLHCQTLKATSFYGEKHVMTGSDDGCVYIYGRESEQLVAVLESGDIINVAEKSPAGPLLVCSGLDDCVHVWQPTLSFEEEKNNRAQMQSLLERARNNNIRA